MKHVMTSLVHWLIVGALCQFCAGAMAQEPNKSEKQAKTPQAETQLVVNINTASLEELQKLPRVGPTIAQRIIDFRVTHKGFKTPEELMNVKGVGEKTFVRLKAHIRI